MKKIFDYLAGHKSVVGIGAVVLALLVSTLAFNIPPVFDGSDSLTGSARYRRAFNRQTVTDRSAVIPSRATAQRGFSLFRRRQPVTNNARTAAPERTTDSVTTTQRPVSRTTSTTRSGDSTTGNTSTATPSKSTGLTQSNDVLTTKYNDQRDLNVNITLSNIHPGQTTSATVHLNESVPFLGQPMVSVTWPIQLDVSGATLPDYSCSRTGQAVTCIQLQAFPGLDSGFSDYGRSVSQFEFENLKIKEAYTGQSAAVTVSQKEDGQVTERFNNAAVAVQDTMTYKTGAQFKVIKNVTLANTLTDLTAYLSFDLPVVMANQDSFEFTLPDNVSPGGTFNYDGHTLGLEKGNQVYYYTNCNVNNRKVMCTFLAQNQDIKPGSGSVYFKYVNLKQLSPLQFTIDDFKFYKNVDGKKVLYLESI